MPERMTRAEAAAELGIDPAAEAQEVQRAFLRAARHVHPDAMPDASGRERADAAARFVRLSLARDVLLQPGPGRSRGIAVDSADTARRTPVARVVVAASGRPSSEFAGSLMVLTLLAFLMVAIVTVDVAVRTHGTGPGPGSVPSVSEQP